MRSESTAPPSVRRLLPILLLLIVAAGISFWLALVPLGSGPEIGPVEEVRTVGRDRYDGTLVLRTGLPLTAAQVSEFALSELARVESHMDFLASGITPGAGWRDVFSELQDDHPGSVGEVLAAYRRELERARGFVAARSLVSLPTQGIEVVEVQNPAVQRTFPLALYRNDQLGVTISPSEDGGLQTHCDVCIPPLAVHEGYPGHHVAFSASDPNTQGDSGAERDLFFHEGWAQYGELLMLEEGYYDDPERELGAWHLVLLRILRAHVDAALHSDEMGVLAAVQLYRDRLLVTDEVARAEVERHLDDPTLKGSYFVGAALILAMRSQLFESQPERDLMEFHDRLLSRPGPLGETAREEFGLEISGLERLSFP